MNTKEQIIELVPALIKRNEKLSRINKGQKNTIIAQGRIIHRQNEGLDHAKKVIADLKSEIETLRASNFEAQKKIIGAQIEALMEPEDESNEPSRELKAPYFDGEKWHIEFYVDPNGPLAVQHMIEKFKNEGGDDGLTIPDHRSEREIVALSARQNASCPDFERMQRMYNQQNSMEGGSIFLAPFS